MKQETMTQWEALKAQFNERADALRAMYETAIDKIDDDHRTFTRRMEDEARRFHDEQRTAKRAETDRYVAERRRIQKSLHEGRKQLEAERQRAYGEFRAQQEEKEM